MVSTHVNQLQLLEQNMQNVLAQKQQFSMQLIETESALKELPNSSSTYKIVGKLMIAKETQELTKELEEQLKLIKLRITMIENQETKIKESIEQVQQEMLAELKTEETDREN
jgi:prefoldin beta subunit